MNLFLSLLSLLAISAISARKPDAPVQTLRHTPTHLSTKTASLRHSSPIAPETSATPPQTSKKKPQLSVIVPPATPSTEAPPPQPTSPTAAASPTLVEPATPKKTGWMTGLKGKWDAMQTSRKQAQAKKKEDSAKRKGLELLKPVEEMSLAERQSEVKRLHRNFFNINQDLRVADMHDQMRTDEARRPFEEKREKQWNKLQSIEYALGKTFFQEKKAPLIARRTRKDAKLTEATIASDALRDAFKKRSDERATQKRDARTKAIEQIRALGGTVEEFKKDPTKSPDEQREAQRKHLSRVARGDLNVFLPEA
jgi:hypothetical protein